MLFAICFKRVKGWRNGWGIAEMRLKVKVLVTQSCPTLRDPINCSPPGSSVHGIFQARILEWLSFPSPGDLPNAGIESRSPALHADSLPTELWGKPSPFLDTLYLICLLILRRKKLRDRDRKWLVQMQTDSRPMFLVSEGCKNIFFWDYN